MRVYGPVGDEVVASAEALTQSHKTMEDVVRWGLACRPPRMVARVVVQDEYTHDVVMPFGEVFLVYDTT